MLDFSAARLTRFSASWVGNKSRYEGVTLPQATLTPLNDVVEEFTTVAMLKPFEKVEEFFYLYDGDDGLTSPVFEIFFNIFDNHETLSVNSGKLATLLYNACESPRIQGGEFFVSIFEDVLLNGEPTQAIGLWKVQSKNPYIGTDRTQGAFTIKVLEGIPSSALEVAALIFNLDENDGYKVFAVDKVSKKTERSFWKDDFLRLRPIEDDYFNTRHYMGLTSEFIQNKAPFKFSLGTPAVIDLLLKAGDYFKDNDEFELDNFIGTIFPDLEQRDEFSAFFNEYQDAYNLRLQMNFNISGQAVKKEAKLFKTAITLDKNFTIQVKSRADLLQTGLDEVTGMKFYKIFFESAQ